MLPNSSNKLKSPDEIWYAKPGDQSLFRVFGCKAMANVPAEKRDNLDNKSKECIFVGYSDDSKAFRLYDNIFISRDVVFIEDEGTEKGDAYYDPFIIYI